jgi:hypothetical protein
MQKDAGSSAGQVEAAHSIRWQDAQQVEKARVDLRRERIAQYLAADGGEKLTRPVVGLALSGGGIRSATFSVGVLRSLSRLGLIHNVDYLSTVSGGGYAGSFYCSLFVPDILRGAALPLDDPEQADVVESAGRKQIKTLGQQPLECGYGRGSLGRLRESGHYLMPAGTSDALYAAVIAFRNWVAVALVTGLAILAFFLLLGLPRVPDAFCDLRDARLFLHATPSEQSCAVSITQWSSERTMLAGSAAAPAPVGAAPERRQPRVTGATPGPAAPTRLVVSKALDEAVPAAAQVAGLLPGASYFWLLVALLVPLWLLPAAWAYWMTRGSPFPKTRVGYFLNVPAFVALGSAALIGVLFWRDTALAHSPIALALGLGTMVGAVLGVGWYLMARVMVRVDDHGKAKPAETVGTPADAGRVAVENRIQTKLSQWLYKGFVCFGCALLIAVVDDVARAIYLHMTHNAGPWQHLTLPGAVSVIAGLVVPVTRWLLSQGQAAKLLTWPRLGPLLRRFARSIALIVALVLLFALMILWDAAAYEIVWHDHPMEVAQPFDGWSKSEWGAAWLPPVLATVFISLCAFVLGHVRSFLNQSSLASFYIGRLRKAYLGATNEHRTQEQECHSDLEHPLDDINLKAYYHSSVLAPVHLINVTINETTAASSRLIQRDRKGKSMTVSPAGYITTMTKPTDEPVCFPFEAPAPEVRSAHRAEELPLSAWVGISGAAFSTGVGRNTSLGQSLLATLVNMRLGYWWDSPTPPSRGEWLFGDLVHRYLLREARAEYEGTHTNRWYLSDGGHYENTGIYELVRRRVPVIVGCDNGADPEYVFSDLISLIRKLRIDFDVEMVFLSADELDKQLGTEGSLRSAFGELRQLGRRQKDEPHKAGPYAALARILYQGPGDRKANTPPTTLILVKPRVAGGELPDLVRYQATNEAFPQQPTADQFFDEAQWESYFRLGQLIADTIFEPKRPESSLEGSSSESPSWFPSEFQPLP